MKLEFLERFSKKVQLLVFCQNPSSGSRVVPSIWTKIPTDGQMDMTKLLIALRNFANAPKNSRSIYLYTLLPDDGRSM
jgi:hypothetical protein